MAKEEDKKSVIVTFKRKDQRADRAKDKLATMEAFALEPFEHDDRLGFRIPFASLHG